MVLVEALSRPHPREHPPAGCDHLPYEFVGDAEKVLPDKRAEIVIYCT